MLRQTARLSLLAVLAVFVVLAAGVTPARAAPGDPGARTGVDVSWPQCDTELPSGVSYAIIGVNGGTAASTNDCLADQLAWANATTTGDAASQPRVQLYVNTANPGEVLEEYAVSTWPTDNVDSRGTDTYATTDDVRRNPYGHCTMTPGNYRGFTNDLACSWQYGWNRAVEAVDLRFAPAAREAGASDVAADYRWWLDVETMNSWQQSGSDAYARNTASLEGMKQFYVSEGVATVGLYSTGYQWRLIVADTLSAPTAEGPAVGGNLRGAPSWLAGARNGDDAQRRCGFLSGLTGGPVVLNQYIEDDLDYNYSCT